MTGRAAVLFLGTTTELHLTDPLKKFWYLRKTEICKYIHWKAHQDTNMTDKMWNEQKETAVRNCRSVTDTGDGETQNDQNNDGETRASLVSQEQALTS